jgi:hypothetical protein
MRAKAISTPAIDAIPAGGTGAIVGAFLDATSRDTAITAMNALLARANTVKADINLFIAEMRCLGLGDLTLSVKPIATADVSPTVPAGGTGVVAGAWDTQAHRDAAIASCNTAITLVDEIRDTLNRMELATRTQSYPPIRSVSLSLIDRASLSAVAAGTTGTGATGGAWTTAVVAGTTKSRDQAITNLQAGLDLIIECRNKVRDIEAMFVRLGVMQP